MPLEALRYPLTPTGMHYLLTHFDIPEVKGEAWLLHIGGLVSKSSTLTLADIKSRPSRTVAVTMECAGNGRALLRPRSISQPWHLDAVGTSEWTGTPLKAMLDEAGIEDEAVEILFTGLDQGVQSDIVHYYQRNLTVDEATRDEVLLAYGMNGEDLQPQHGFPLRLIVPGWYGMTSVKWLDRIEAVGEPFQGPQMDFYRYTQGADDPGESANLIKVRALMSPPGIPDFLTRIRLVRAGPVPLSGRAWAGRLGISRGEVSHDDGVTWAAAQLDDPLSPYAWRGWSLLWQARPGTYNLCVRATDTEGNNQPLSQAWNSHGLGNNMVQRVEVVVE